MSPHSQALHPVAAQQAAAIREAVKDRLIDYWWDVDRHGASGAPDFYTEDCLYLMCGHRMEGRDAIRRYYDYRAARGERLVRHVLANLRVQVASVDAASLSGVLCVYAADGVPVLPSAPPILVADTECEFVREAGDVWRLRSHAIVALFAGGVPVLVPPPGS